MSLYLEIRDLAKKRMKILKDRKVARTWNWRNLPLVPFVCFKGRTWLGWETERGFIVPKTHLLGTARILCFQNEEMTFKGPLVASYDHDWPD